MPLFVVVYVTFCRYLPKLPLSTKQVALSYEFFMENWDMMFYSSNDALLLFHNTDNNFLFKSNDVKHIDDLFHFTLITAT